MNATANSNPEMQANRSDALLRNYLKRNQSLQRWAWISVAVPLVIFLGLSALTVRQGQKFLELSAKSADLQRRIEDQNAQLAVKQLAIDIVKQQNPGKRPKVVIFRPRIASDVKEAIEQLGYTVELRSALANPSLFDKPVDTLSSGCAVGSEDIRTIGTALAKANLPIKQIEPATRNRDPSLVQLVASSATNATDRPIQMESWSRPDKACEPHP